MKSKIMFLLPFLMLGCLSISHANQDSETVLGSQWIKVPEPRVVLEAPLKIKIPTYRDTTGSGPKEVELELAYRILCDRNAPVRAMGGEIFDQMKRIRFELFEPNQLTKVSLGRAWWDESFIWTNVELTLNPTQGCELKEFKYRPILVGPPQELNSKEGRLWLAKKHSPFMVVRPEFVLPVGMDRYKDLPIKLGYTFKEKGSVLELIYTLFFTDEDSKPTLEETDAQMARYGRRLDVEWIYKIELNPSTFEVQGKRYFQGSIWRDYGYTEGINDFTHSKKLFAGSFLPGSHHPILYNIFSNNVFSHHPENNLQKRATGYHLVPTPLDEIPEPEAREMALFREPWALQVSDEEMEREGKLSQPYTDYLYVLVEGILDGRFRVRIDLRDLETRESHLFLSGSGRGNVDRLGEDLWGKQAFTAIPLTTDYLNKLSFDGSPIGALQNGKLTFEDVSWLGTDFKLENLKFFRFRLDAEQGRVAAEDVTKAFSCFDSNDPGDTFAEFALGRSYENGLDVVCYFQVK